MSANGAWTSAFGEFQEDEDCRQFLPVDRYGAYAVLEFFLTDEEFGNLDDEGWPAIIKRMQNALEQCAPFGTFKPDAAAECEAIPSDVAVDCVH